MQPGQPHQYQIIPVVGGQVVTSSQVVQIPAVANQPIYSEAYAVNHDGLIRQPFDGELHPPALMHHMPYHVPHIASGHQRMMTMPTTFHGGAIANKSQEMWNYAIDSVIRREVRKEYDMSHKKRRGVRRERSFSESLYDRVKLPADRHQMADSILNDDPLYEDLDSIRDSSRSAASMISNHNGVTYHSHTDSVPVNYHSHTASFPVNPPRERVYSDPPQPPPNPIDPIYATYRHDANDIHNDDSDKDMMCGDTSKYQVIGRFARLQSRSEPNLLDSHTMGMLHEMWDLNHQRSASNIRLSCLEEVEI